MADTTQIVRVPILSLSTALGITFIVLKLCGVIGWSWWLVTLPLWIGWAIVLAIILAIFAAIGIGAIIVAMGALISR